MSIYIYIDIDTSMSIYVYTYMFIYRVILHLAGEWGIYQRSGMNQQRLQWTERILDSSIDLGSQIAFSSKCVSNAFHTSPRGQTLNPES